MEIEILNKSKNEITFKVKNMDYTVLDLLRKELMLNKSVKFAGYTLDHPLTKEATFVVKTDGVTPNKAVKDAVSSIKKQIKELKSNINKLDI